MHISDFDYELPPELIASEPARPRDSSRMMVLDRATGDCTDSSFRKLAEFLAPSDVLVINDTRVIRARIHGRLERATGTSRDVEVLFAAPAGKDVWEVMVRPGKRVREGDRIVFAGGKLEGMFGIEQNHGLRLLHIASHIDQILESHGHVPLPPYIERPDSASDALEYQTVYASVPGAVRSEEHTSELQSPC